MGDMAQKIYLITTGEYSDYRVHSAWSTEELAKKKIAQMGPAGSAELYAWTLDDDPDLAEGLWPGWQAEIDFETGQAEDEWRNYPLMCEGQPRTQLIRDPGRSECFTRILSFHKTEALALKAARDARAKELARGEGL